MGQTFLGLDGLSFGLSVATMNDRDEGLVAVGGSIDCIWSGVGGSFKRFLGIDLLEISAVGLSCTVTESFGWLRIGLSVISSVVSLGIDLSDGSVTAGELLLLLMVVAECFSTFASNIPL